MWIAFTLLAAWFQSMRTAHQNTLSKQTGGLHATLARSLFGLPLVTLYLVVCWLFIGEIHQLPDAAFYWLAALGAVTQVVATYLMLHLFKVQSFASGTLFSKTEALMTALLGLWLFATPLSLAAWVGVFIGVVGIIILSIKPGTGWQQLRQVSTLIGLASGLCFAITSLTVALASRQLEGHFMTRAGMTLVFVLAVQALLLWGIQAVKEKDLLSPFRAHFTLSHRVGMLSAVGSIGWFTAFSLTNPALVKTLGQIEVIGTLYYSKYRFAEPLRRQEWLGGGCIIFSVICVALAV